MVGLSKETDLLIELKEILSQENIRTVYQPIVSLKDGNILGYEALSRGPLGSKLEKPVELFSVARKNGMVWELELLCRTRALEGAKNTLNGYKLFLNVDPHIINDEKFQKGFTLDFLKQYNINPASIIFEITEKSAIVDFKTFRKALDNYIEQGYKIAIDDIGSGYSGLKMLTEVSPKYIKIDMDLIRDVDKDYLKRALLETLYKFSLMTNMSIIAEGIETEEELNALIAIGIEYGQGYFIQKPSEGFLNVLPRAKAAIIARKEARKRLYFNHPTTLPVGEIARFEMPISPHVTGEEVDNIFRNNPSIYGIPIVEKNNKPVGLLMRNKFYSYLASQFGYALYKSRPINLILDKNPLILDYYTPLDQVSRISVTRKEEQLYDYVIITRDDSYYGITTIKDLLVNTTELELNIAKHSNPLTGLPGNLIIEERLKTTISSSSSYGVVYVDIDNFKTYNDTYGFENGDQVILTTVSILSKELQKAQSQNAFLGHIGGDDFLLIASQDKVEEICKGIIKEFEKIKMTFYSEQDKKNGYVLAKGRQESAKKHPLITISLAIVTGSTDDFNNIIELVEKLTLVKKSCKAENCSCYIVADSRKECIS